MSNLPTNWRHFHSSSPHPLSPWLCCPAIVSMRRSLHPYSLESPCCHDNSPDECVREELLLFIILAFSLLWKDISCLLARDSHGFRHCFFRLSVSLSYSSEDSFLVQTNFDAKKNRLDFGGQWSRSLCPHKTRFWPQVKNLKTLILSKNLDKYRIGKKMIKWWPSVLCNNSL